mgnify:CR=1 FL=1
MEEKGDKVRQKTIEQELEWVRQNPKGRRKKAKARLNNYEALLAEERNVKLDQVQIHIPAGQRLGDKVIESDTLRKGFGERLLIEDLSFTLPPAGIVGVIGANGAGKTTLFRMIVGDEKPDAGKLDIGDTVDLAYVDQSRDSLDPDSTVYEEITGGVEFMKVGTREVNGRAYCASFNFRGPDQQKLVVAGKVLPPPCSGASWPACQMSMFWLVRRPRRCLAMDRGSTRWSTRTGSRARATPSSWLACSCRSACCPTPSGSRARWT